MILGSDEIIEKDEFTVEMFFLFHSLILSRNVYKIGESYICSCKTFFTKYVFHVFHDTF